MRTRGGAGGECDRRKGFVDVGLVDCPGLCLSAFLTRGRTEKGRILFRGGLSPYTLLLLGSPLLWAFCVGFERVWKRFLRRRWPFFSWRVRFQILWVISFVGMRIGGGD